MSEKFTLAEVELKSDEIHTDESCKRLRLFYLYQILLKYSDFSHPLSTIEIIQLMKELHGIDMHRTTLPKDISMLIGAGCEVVVLKGRPNKYYLQAQAFEIPELKILIDAVESSHLITEKKSRSLVKKILTLTNEANSYRLTRNIKCSGRVRSKNEKVYYIVDAINDAINEKKRILFYYIGYNIHKEPYLRNNGLPYEVSPFSLVWNGDYYYLVGYDHNKDTTCHYRIDRIREQPVLLNHKSEDIPADFDLARYTKEVFRMFDNEPSTDVVLRCHSDVMGGVVDKFGVEFEAEIVDDSTFLAHVRVCPSPAFFAWVFQWGGKIAILSPEPVKTSYSNMLTAGQENT